MCWNGREYGLCSRRITGLKSWWVILTLPLQTRYYLVSLAHNDASCCHFGATWANWQTNHAHLSSPPRDLGSRSSLEDPAVCHWFLLAVIDASCVKNTGSDRKIHRYAFKIKVHNGFSERWALRKNSYFFTEKSYLKHFCGDK